MSLGVLSGGSTGRARFGVDCTAAVGACASPHTMLREGLVAARAMGATAEVARGVAPDDFLAYVRMGPPGLLVDGGMSAPAPASP